MIEHYLLTNRSRSIIALVAMMHSSHSSCFSYSVYRRVALHKYDPPDHVSTVLHAPTITSNATATEEPKKAAPILATPAKTKEMEQAVAKGLQVDFGRSPDLEDTTPISLGSPVPGSPTLNSRNLDFGGIDDEDSDDDLL